jgi:5-methyltetrahydropteroyltriglutamate--homocysteine methyltransferase
VLKGRPSVISFEAANPRHEHEWRVFEDVKLPEDKTILPGVIDSTTNYVEHPERSWLSGSSTSPAVWSDEIG